MLTSVLFCLSVLLYFQSQAEAHYKGNRHARRVKGIETSKTGRTQDGDKAQPPPPSSPLTPGPSPSSPEVERSMQGEQPWAYFTWLRKY